MQKEENMNLSQVRVVLQYVITAAMSYAVAKGWLPQDVASEAGAWAIAGLPVVYAVWKSRDAGKVATAANVDGVTVIAPAAITNALPAHASVVSSAETKVVSK